MKIRLGFLLLALVQAAPAVAEAQRAPLPQAYVEECGSCHVPFPGRMLDAASWGSVADGLERHFGVDASLDPKELEPIRAYLASSARRKPTAAADGKPQLRITETRWYRHEHDEVPIRLRKGADAVKPADCGVCHTQAAVGSYSERSLHLPKPGEGR